MKLKNLTVVLAALVFAGPAWGLERKAAFNYGAFLANAFENAPRRMQAPADQRIPVIGASDEDRAKRKPVSLKQRWVEPLAVGGIAAGAVNVLLKLKGPESGAPPDVVRFNRKITGVAALCVGLGAGLGAALHGDMRREIKPGYSWVLSTFISTGALSLGTGIAFVGMTGVVKGVFVEGLILGALYGSVTSAIGAGAVEAVREIKGQ